ncbi:MAG: pyridoxal-phosphate dependent enzyme [Bacteroidales bacterium]|nr:pyridoxal-phosphate dependent enzyme [Bacteroidales bacterium]
MNTPSNSCLPDSESIRTTWQKLSGIVKQTPVLTSETLNSITGSELFFKCENFQKAGAFKFRGASSALMQISEKQAARGVCTHSSGNHAQALALAAKIRGLKAFIVMPENAPAVKVNAVRDYGGQITFCIPTLEARESTLEEVRKATGASFIHPYNNYDIIRGQAGCFFEMLQQMDEEPDYIIAPLGGGGLLSGTILSAKYFTKNTKVIGAEPLMANDAWKSFREKKFIPSDSPQTIADGLKTSLGTKTYPIIMEHVEDIITATEEGIIDAMFLVWERMKILIEPSAAVPLAALMENPERFRNKKTGIIFSGGNTDLRRIPWMEKKYHH